MAFQGLPQDEQFAVDRFRLYAAAHGTPAISLKVFRSCCLRTYDREVCRKKIDFNGGYKTISG